MNNYMKSHVVSVRIAPDLLEVVRARARAEGRSVSGEIVFIVRDHVQSRPEIQHKPRAISGWLRHLADPGTHAEFRTGRTKASSQMRQAILEKARKR